MFTTSYLTQKGLDLVAKLNTNPQELKITRALGGDGIDPQDVLSERTGISHAALWFETFEGVKYEDASKIKVPLYFENSGLMQTVKLTEIALFAMDPTEGEILLGIAVSYEDPLVIPRFAEGRVELTCDYTIQLSLSPDVEVTLCTSLVYLTKPEGDARYWRIGTKYPATEITESVGRTVEDHQRWQDERLDQLEVMAKDAEDNSIPIEFDSRKPLKWQIINNHGWYDAALSAYRCGDSEHYLPDEIPPGTPEPDPETPGGSTGGTTGGGQKALGKR